MEITCTRCHQAIDDGSTYCPMCGLPQLLYQADAAAGAAQPERRAETVRDAASIAWKPAMTVAARLSVPTGMVFAVFFLYSVANESGFLGLLFLMAAAAAWVVAIYMRSQKPAWITIGAGARIGLVTGIMSAWMATAMCGLMVFGARYWFGRGAFIDNFWMRYAARLSDFWIAIGIDSATVATLKATVLTPQGRAEASLSMAGTLAIALLLFAIAGGALGARFLAPQRRPEV